ncbi:MAG: TerC/Alx family metal homeostasis membrane protein [Bacteriovoracaceae bacterium]|nr:TerC/Alx family metal homeostasis membrane protein [Bacteriovoracaceae bacterium]
MAVSGQVLTLIFIGLCGLGGWLDFHIINHRGRDVTFTRSIVASLLWAVLAGIYGGIICLTRNFDLGMQFWAGFVVEESLSVDNLFVFLLIFSYFKVPPHAQRRILVWGILGAMVMRGVFIAAGVTLLQLFSWIIYLLGAFLVFTGFKLFKKKDDEEEIDLEKNLFLKMARKKFHFVNEYEDDKFFNLREGKKIATPMLIVLGVVETTDLVFAVDSIPTILGISQDTLVVYTSNILAVMGLRSLYFALSGVIQYFYYLHYALAVILSFIGIKMLIHHWVEIPVGYALGFVLLLLLIAVIASVIRQYVLNKKKDH